MSEINTSGLNFGGATGYIHTVGNLMINSPITGSGGVVKSALGSLALNGVNTFTGGLTLNSGNLLFTSDANLGAPGEPITLNGGQTGAFTLQQNNILGQATSQTETINRPVTVGPAGRTRFSTRRT